MFWTKKDKTKIKISDMTTEHIQNCIAMLERNGWVKQSTFEFYLLGPRPNGDMAQDAFESEFDAICQKKPTKFLDLFAEELKKRGING